MKRQAGNTLFVALLAMATLAVCVAVAVDLSVGIGRNAQRSRAWSDGTAIGIGSLDLAFSGWRQLCRAPGAGVLTTNQLSSIPAPTTSNFPAIPTFTISNYGVQAVDPQLNPIDPSATPPPAAGQNASTSSYFYLASADVTIPVIPGNVTVKVRRVFEKQNVSPWNWAIFYNDPLEIHPSLSANMTVTGWVHTNGMLYTGHNTLTFASKVTYTAGWKIGFMPGDGAHPETPTSPYWPTDLPPAPDQSHQPFGLDPSQAFNTTDTNPNNDGWHELIERAVLPLSTYPDPIAGWRYYDQAGIKVLINSTTSNITVLKQDGTAAGTTLTTTIQDAITFQTIQDNREGATVKLSTLDLSAIYNGGSYDPVTSDNSKGLKGFNGIIYLVDTTASSSAHRAIRLKNGSKLAAGGLTIASENPIYVQGNFNTGAGTPPSNTGDPTNPTVAGYTRQPAAIIGDAVNILSNAWPSSNELTYSNQAVGSRVASNTTVNAAILAGIVPTGTVGSNYSGGVENFPRFLEDWTGKSFTYYGSMVELYPSQQATGIWGSNNVYVPPNRNWYFDTNFYSNPPKGSLVLTNYVKQKWFLQ